MGGSPDTPGGTRPASLLLWCGLALVAVISLVPLLCESLPAGLLPPFASARATYASREAVILVMGLTIAIGAWPARRDEPLLASVVAMLLLAAAAMTATHYECIDRLSWDSQWQRKMYLNILNHTADAPHVFRALPYGFTRSLEWLTGDWLFSCVVYRGFFTYWFLWGAYRFARLWFRPHRALLAVIPLVLLYPPSIAYYWGQLTDPLSHALFVLALILVVRDRWVALAAALALGVLAKETVVLMVPVYWACYWRGGVKPLLKASFLGAVCVAAALAARVPLGWWLGYENINGTERLMIFDNLGIGEPLYRSAAPIYQNYLQPALFVLPFVPFIVWGWRRLDGRLKAICLTLPPPLLLSNLCFGWMYESRNYMPLLPPLATAALFAVFPAPRQRRDANRGGDSLDSGTASG
jgi:hypothetical protein